MFGPNYILGDPDNFKSCQHADIISKGTGNGGCLPYDSWSTNNRTVQDNNKKYNLVERFQPLVNSGDVVLAAYGEISFSCNSGWGGIHF